MPKPRAKAKARTRARAKAKGIRTPYVTVLPSPRLCASCLLAGTELIIGTICAARGRATFHSQKKARAVTNPTTTLTNKTITTNIIPPAASSQSRVRYRADATFVVIVAAEVAAVAITLKRARSARGRGRRRMGLQAMAANARPSGTRAIRDHQARVRVQEVRPSRIPIFGIPMAPLSSRSGRPGFVCTNRRCRKTRPTSPMCSKRGEGIRAANGRNSPSTGSTRRRQRTLRAC